MKATWHRASGSIIDKGDQRGGTVSVFYEYNLLNWFFGWSLDVDDCWYDFKLGFGPFGLSFNYWRRYAAER